MKKKIAFLLDTGSSYNLNEPDCYIVPMVITVEENGKEISYFDGENITRKELVSFLNEHKKVSTSQPVVGMVMEKIEDLLTKYDLIISVPFTKGLSSTYNTLLTLQKEYGEDKLLVADANEMSTSGNWLVKELKEHLNSVESFTQADLDKFTSSVVKRLCGAVIVTDVNQLIAGGRLKGIKGLIAKTLKLKLVIKYEGNLEFSAKDKTLEGAINKTLDVINSRNNFRKKGIKNISIFADLSDKKENDKYIDYVKSIVGVDANYSDGLLPGCVIMHTGNDTFSILIEANE